MPQWDRTHLRTVAFVQEDTKDTILQGISARLCAMCGGNGSGTFLGGRGDGRLRQCNREVPHCGRLEKRAWRRPLSSIVGLR